MNQEHLFYEEDAIKIITNEYNLGFIDGKFGSGKTAFLSYIANDFQNVYEKIYCNYHLNLPNAVFLPEINRDIILDLNDGYEEGDKKSLAVLQESYQYFDKRFCMKKTNKGIQTALFQIRKLGIDILADIPSISYLDFRSQDNATMYFNALGKITINGIDTNRFLYRGISSYDLTGDSTFTIEMTELFNKNVYNTMEKTRTNKVKNEKSN